MSQQVLPVVGAIIGSFWGSPQLGWAIGAAIGGVVASTESKPGPRLGELPPQSFDEGTPRAIVYGTSQTSGYVIAAAPAIKTVEFVDGGGKGGGSVETEVAYRSYAIAMCEGPIAGVLRVWADDKLVYDVRPESLIQAESARWIQRKQIYLGDEDQLPDAFLQLNVSGPDTPAYRGTAYMVFGLEDLSDRRGTIPMYRFEVAGTASLLPTANPLIVHPWAHGDNPVNPLNQHEFRYVGFEFNSGSPQPSSSTSGAIRASLAESLSDMRTGWNTDFRVRTPPALDEVFHVAWTTNGLTYPVDAVVAGQQESIRLQYNCVRAVSHSETSLPSASYPDVQDGGGIWGAYSLRNAVAYRSAAPITGTQWQSDQRIFSTATFSGSVAGGLNVWYSYDGYINAKRVPSPPDGFERVVGTAKQLAQVEYKSGVLYQNGLGPVLLPDHPDYDNDEFWEAEREAAIDRGDLKSDVTSPVVVSAYATGYITATGLPIPLDGIVSDLCLRVGLAEGDIDVSELDDSVLGLTLAGDYTAASAIDVLRSCYFFDKTEPGDKLYFPKRGKAVALTLDIDDLVEAPDMSRREQASEVPKKLHLHYANATAGYAPIKTTYTRSSQDIQSNLETSLQVPVVLDTDSAAQMVDKMFKVTTADAQGEIKLSIPSSFIRLVPSDCIGLNLRGQVRRLRIDDIEMADGVMHLTCRADRQSAYTSILTGIPVDPPLMPPSTIPGETVYAVLDIPARVDSEDDLNYLVAGTGASEGWTGWSYQLSFDGGANFSTVRSITANAVIGNLLDPINAASEHYTDTTNVVRIQLVNVNQVIEGQTVQAFLSESGAFALEGASGWEILQYLDADDEGDGVFALSVLHRGLLNTAPTAHAQGALFVLLDRASHIPAQAAWIGQDLTHRGVSVGNTVEGAVITTETFTGQSQIEWPVSYLTLGRDSSDVITGQWVPRHRFGADVNPVASINFQGFRVTLDDGVDTVSFDVTTPSFTYDASAMSAPVDVSVAPINRITGPGPAVTESI